jgi:hypothetical protein
MVTAQEAAFRGLTRVAVESVDGGSVEITGDAVVDTTSLEAIVATETTLASVLAAIGNAEDEANDPTVIGLLKQVIVKLGDVESALGG